MPRDFRTKVGNHVLPLLTVPHQLLPSSMDSTPEVHPFLLLHAGRAAHPMAGTGDTKYTLISTSEVSTLSPSPSGVEFLKHSSLYLFYYGVERTKLRPDSPRFQFLLHHLSTGQPGPLTVPRQCVRVALSRALREGTLTQSLPSIPFLLLLSKPEPILRCPRHCATKVSWV